VRRGRAPIPATKRMAHTFVQAPAHYSIEVNRQRVIVQCRGRFNALPTPQDMEMLRRWATAERLVISGHLT
jgi:hypothetical protein